MDFGMPLNEAMITQRAIRRLKLDRVDDEIILDLIDLALKAPTGSNGQNWEFIILKDPKVKKRLARFNRQIWRLSGPIGLWRTRNDPKRRKILEAVLWQAEHFEEAPVIVVACLRGWYFPFMHLSATTYFGSIYPAIQNLLLAARAINLGAALTSGTWRQPAWHSACPGTLPHVRSFPWAGRSDTMVRPRENLFTRLCHLTGMGIGVTVPKLVESG